MPKLACTALLLALAAFPSFGAEVVLSDWLRVFDPQGNIFAEVTATEEDEIANGDAFVYSIPNVPVDPNMFGQYTTLWQGDPSTVSDVFGIATNADLTLAFSSDIDGIPFFFSNLAPGPAGHFEEKGLPFDATMYLDPALRAQGYTAKFFSDPNVGVPEPGVGFLVGCGLLTIAFTRARLS